LAITDAKAKRPPVENGQAAFLLPGDWRCTPAHEEQPVFFVHTPDGRTYIVVVGREFGCCTCRQFREQDDCPHLRAIRRHLANLAYPTNLHPATGSEHAAT